MENSIVEKLLKRARAKYVDSCHFMAERIYYFNWWWESDLLLFRKSGIIEEIEIKTSRADFFKDFGKKRKHLRLQSKEGNIPNKFTYLVPEGLVKPEEVPEYAGLVYVGMNDLSAVTVKLAPILSQKQKINYEKLTTNFYTNWRNETSKTRNLKLKIEELENQLKYEPSTKHITNLLPTRVEPEVALSAESENL